jgi:general secretion pathway protein H
VSTRTSATGISTERLTPRAWSGFSLLELLVVVTIIGIFAGAAILSMGVLGRDRIVEREAIRFRTLLNLLREEALMESRDYGVVFTETAYSLYVFDYQRAIWVQPEGDAMLGTHELPEGVALELELEDRSLVLESAATNSDDKDPEPQVILLSSGELTPFQLSFFRPPGLAGFTLRASLDGTLEIVSRDG